MPTLVDKLNSLCEFLDNSYGINHGGCCFVSSIIARYLDNLGIEYNLVIFDDDDRVEDNVTYNVQNNCNHYCDDSVIGFWHTCSHYCIEIINSDDIIGEGIINSDDCDADDYYMFRIPRINHENIDYLLDQGVWNKQFKYYDYYDIISNMIHELFREYENYTKESIKMSKVSDSNITFTSQF